MLRMIKKLVTKSIFHNQAAPKYSTRSSISVSIKYSQGRQELLLCHSSESSPEFFLLMNFLH
uniref:Putative ovule protein n=1 Tax=Solanum chacoense TaxID=4108 RepID=A0A0V0H7C7_SOLCH